MKNKPLITILTVSYNAEKTISRTIESVLNQTYGNIEYIIIDGASNDGTVEVAQSYQEIFDNASGRSLTIISEPDKGMYDGLNKGAKLAHGVLVGQINADDWYEKNAVSIMVKLYNQYHYDFAWGNIKIHKSTGSFIKKAHSNSTMCYPLTLQDSRCSIFR